MSHRKQPLDLAVTAVVDAPAIVAATAELADNGRRIGGWAQGAEMGGRSILRRQAPSIVPSLA